MIKKFISRIEELSTDAWIAILAYVDDKLDTHDDRIGKLENRLDAFENDFEPTKAEVESSADTRKLIKKTALTVIVGAIIGFMLRHFGI